MVQILGNDPDQNKVNLYNALGIFLPLIGMNRAILGGSVHGYVTTFNESVVFGVGSGVGWDLVIAALKVFVKSSNIQDVLDGPKGLGIHHCWSDVLSTSGILIQL